MPTPYRTALSDPVHSVMLRFVTIIVAVLALAAICVGLTRMYLVAQNKTVQLGAAVAVESLRNDPQYRETLQREFALLTPEIAMKWDILQPSRGLYDFRHADEIVSFAAANHKQVRGHTLVWHRALPGWLTSSSIAVMN